MAASHAPASHSARRPVRSRTTASVSGRSGTTERGEADVDGELGPVEPLWPTARGRCPWAAGWDGRCSRRGGGVGVSESIRHEDVDGHPREGSRWIAEHRLGPRVGRDDPAGRVGHDGGVGHQSQDGVDELRRAGVASSGVRVHGGIGVGCRPRRAQAQRGGGSTCGSAPVLCSHCSNVNGAARRRTQATGYPLMRRRSRRRRARRLGGPVG